jgi:hypothetical protein
MLSSCRVEAGEWRASSYSGEVDVDMTDPLEPVAGVVLVEHVAHRGEPVVADTLDRRVGQPTRRRPRLLDEGAALGGVRVA